MVAQFEMSGMSKDERDSLKSYRNTLEVNKSFCDPYFEKFVRFYKLFSGQLPHELDGTFSKIMLWFAFAAVENETAKTVSDMLNTPNYFDLEANSPMLETQSDAAKQWTRYQLEKKQQIQTQIIPTSQATQIFGVGYRHYGYKYNTREKKVRKSSDIMGMPHNFTDDVVTERYGTIVGNNMSVFNVLPSPSGGMVNDIYKNNENVNDAIIIMTYPTENEIKSFVQKGLYDKKQASNLLKMKGGNENDPTLEYKQDIVSGNQGWSTLNTPQWIRTIRDHDLKLNARYRVAWMYTRNKWIAVGEDKFVLYHGEPLMDFVPLAKFTSTYNLDNWFGFGLVEPTEDLLLAILQNFNHRSDYLAGTLHPSTFVPKDLLEELGGDKSIFDPQPYQVIPYSHDEFENIGAQVHRDRFPEISQQAFFEEGKMQEFMQEITGQPNLGKGLMTGQGGDLGTTGVVSLLSAGFDRNKLRSINFENSGIHDCIYLTLKFGEKFVDSPEKIRITGADGWPWTEVDPDIITDGYGISITGTAGRNMEEEVFKKMLASAQMLVNNPVVQDQVELTRQLMEKSGYQKVDSMLGQERPSLPMTGGKISQPGGVASAQNDIRSQFNRSTVAPNTGVQVAAGNVAI